MVHAAVAFFIGLHYLVARGVHGQCPSPLGMEDGSIPDEKIQSWSPMLGRFFQAKARLNDPFAWCTAEDPTLGDVPFLQVYLEGQHEISGIAVKGFGDSWVTEFVVDYKVGNDFQRYKEPSSDTEVIQGNRDAESVLKINFGKPFAASVVRVIPVSKHGLSCLRLELFGCGAAFKTCQELQQNDPSSATSNKAYELEVDSKRISVYCHMTTINECGAGAWTLAMKIDGSKNTFGYHSNYWTDKNAYNEKGGETGFDRQEAKLATYWNTPFTRICLGMEVGGKTKFLPIDKQAPSLHSLIADGNYRSTTIGRDGWKGLVTGSSLQWRCNREGFNVVADRTSSSKARIGIIGNNENDCITTDSRVGFGTGGYPDDGNSCGYISRHGGDSGDRSAKAMGYIFIGSPPPLATYPSCSALRNAQPHMATSNRAYRIRTSAGQFPVFCHMTSISGCGYGGWTLVMKIEGSKNTFSYDSGYWTNRNAYNMNGGLSGFDYQQTKLPTYWSTPFTKICLGMRVGGTTRFVLVSQSAGSLFSLIAGGKYRATSLHRNAWRSLVPNSSLQHHCGRQGFNVVSDRNGWSKARIGIINNNENNCETPDSRVGFGTGGHPDNNLSCGNIARHGGDIGDRTIPAIGYILVM